MLSYIGGKSRIGKWIKDYIPTDIDYHQVGLMLNPTALDSIPLPANNALYKTTTDFVVAPGFGAFTNDEYIYILTQIQIYIYDKSKYDKHI